MADNNPSSMIDPTTQLNLHYEEWQKLAPLGLTVIGFGLSVTGQAITLKTNKRGFWKWFIVGTIGLSITNAGISIFGESVKHRALYETLYKQIRKT